MSDPIWKDLPLHEKLDVLAASLLEDERRTTAASIVLDAAARLTRLEAVLAAARDVADDFAGRVSPPIAEHLRKLREAIRLCDSQEDGKGEGG